MITLSLFAHFPESYAHMYDLFNISVNHQTVSYFMAGYSNLLNSCFIINLVVLVDQLVEAVILLGFKLLPFAFFGGITGAFSK